LSLLLEEGDESVTATIETALDLLPDGLAGRVGISQDQLHELTPSHIHNLGEFVLLGTNRVVAAMRFHYGPEGSIWRGGTKFKDYEPSPNPTAALIQDGTDHGESMFDKQGALGLTDYGGGKTIADVPTNATTEQRIDAIRQIARLKVEAGLADPAIDGTAGDERTNDLIDYYVDELRRLGVPHPEACVTGKSDMVDRPPATGEGAIIALRAYRELIGEESPITSIFHGAGAAGLYAAAELTDPTYDDHGQEGVIYAIGDRNPVTGEQQTLYTNQAAGLPLKRTMVDGVLRDPRNDRDMQAVKGYRLAALARKLERLGSTIRIGDHSSLFHDRGSWLLPASTSNVITRDSLRQIKAENVNEISNHAVHETAIPLASQHFKHFIPGQAANAGGFYMSVEERRRDLNRIKAESGTPYIEPTSSEYRRALFAAMETVTRKVAHVADVHHIDMRTAVKIVSLAHYALSRGMTIDRGLQSTLAEVA